MKYFFFIISVLFSLINASKYTNNQAFQCFVQKGLVQCHDSFSKCTENEICKA